MEINARVGLGWWKSQKRWCQTHNNTNLYHLYLGVLGAPTKSRLFSTQGSHLAACCFLELSHFLFEHHQKHIVGVLHLTFATDTKCHTHPWHQVTQWIKAEWFHDAVTSWLIWWDITNIRVCQVRGCQGTAFIFDFGGFHLGFHLKKIPLKDFEDPWKQTKSDPISKIPHLGLHSFQLFFFWLDQPFIHRLLCRQTLIACMSDHKSNQWHISCLSWFSSAMTYLSWKVCALSWRA